MKILKRIWVLAAVLLLGASQVYAGTTKSGAGQKEAAPETRYSKDGKWILETQQRRDPDQYEQAGQDDPRKIPEQRGLLHHPKLACKLERQHSSYTDRTPVSETGSDAASVV